jgi:hypothetical protein
MPDIPSSINGVAIDFGSSVNKDVTQNMINGLKACIKTDIASGYTLTTIYISSASDSHTGKSRHVTKQAVDISRINGKKWSVTMEVMMKLQQSQKKFKTRLKTTQKGEKILVHILQKNLERILRFQVTITISIYRLINK